MWYRIGIGTHTCTCAEISMAGTAEEEKVKAFTERACQAYRQITQIPSVAGARIHSAGEGAFEVAARWSQRDVERGKKLGFAKSYFVQRGERGLEKRWTTAFQAYLSNIVKVTYATKAEVKAVLVNDKPAKVAGKAEGSSEPELYIEVWNRDALVKTIEVSSLKKHGKINEDAYFASFQLSADGKRLLYIAEKEKPKTTSFFKKNAEKSEGDQLPRRGAEYVFEPSWGEQLEKVICPVAVVMDLESEECSIIETESVGDISAGQAQWVPGEEGGVVFVGWENTPRKLGFVYCNRRSSLYYANTQSGECTRLTDTAYRYAVFSPRFNPQGDKLVFFEAVADGPHHTCAALKLIEWPSRRVSTVVDVVNRPQPGAFPGFYTLQLPERCWDSSGKRIVLHDWWRSLQEVLCVEVGSGEVHRVRGEGASGAWTVHDVAGDLVVAQFASPNTSPRLMAGVLPANVAAESIQWTELASTSSPLTDGVVWEIMEFTPEEEGALSYEAVLITPRRDDSSPLPPLAVAPHGGPHVALVADFFLWPTCLTALGFAVLLVNFRGSSGFGQDSVFSLPGKISTQDVSDVQSAARVVVKGGKVDGERVVVFGGSHGGFLSVHLIAQFPDFYKAAVARNPVVNASAHAMVTDIPDWGYVEVGMTYDPSQPPTAEVLSKLLAVSPIILAPKIKAPLLIQLGSEDRRVPPSQGVELYHLLKAMGKEVKLLMYPGECHPISSVYSEADAFVNGVTWLFRWCST